MKVQIRGYTTLSGRPLAIVKMIQDAQFFQEDTPKDPEEFIQSLQHTLWRAFGIKAGQTEGTPEERAESILRDMADKGIIDILKEEK